MLRRLLPSLCFAAVAVFGSPDLPPPAQAGTWWSSLFQSPPPPDPAIPRAGRPAGSGFCAIAPAETRLGEELPLSQSDRPTLVWVGALESIELWQAGGETWLWRQQMTDDLPLQPVRLRSGQIVYRVMADVALQPGQQYEWRVWEPRMAAVSVRFAVLPEAQQAEIQQNLPAAGAAPIGRADYFASQQLWSDFWSEVLSIEPPSEPLDRAMDSAIDRLCPS